MKLVPHSNKPGTPICRSAYLSILVRIKITNKQIGLHIGYIDLQYRVFISPLASISNAYKLYKYQFLCKGTTATQASCVINMDALNSIYDSKLEMWYSVLQRNNSSNDCSFRKVADVVIIINFYFTIWTFIGASKNINLLFLKCEILAYPQKLSLSLEYSAERKSQHACIHTSEVCSNS